MDDTPKYLIWRASGGWHISFAESPKSHSWGLTIEAALQMLLQSRIRELEAVVEERQQKISELMRTH